ncbi:alpha/beta hydrolase [Staphylococcus sp. 11261D007BR]
MTKKSMHLVDADLQEAAQNMGGTELTRENLETYRENVLSHAKSDIPSEYDVTLDHQTVTYDGHDIPIIVIQPTERLDHMPAYLYMHGGGMLSGGAHLDNRDNALLAHELGCVVVSVDYRLAPETIFPGQLEDCYAVLKWMVDNNEQLNIDASRIAVGGSSAGGLLAASLSQYALDLGEIPILFQNLHIPMLDHRTLKGEEPNPFSGEFGWTRAMNHFAWEMYLGQEVPVPLQDLPDYASPAQRDNLENLPPTLITVGSLDLFVDESMAYAHRLINAGVPTELHVYPGLYHLGELVPGARIKDQILKDRVNALKRAFNDPHPQQ